jgi:hypothetical protein
MSALRAEHREVKCLWLSEKSDLESRCFQLQALHTQLQGTLRKKEKDYDRLQVSNPYLRVHSLHDDNQLFLITTQNQLSKITTTTQRAGAKASAQQQSTPVMVLTQPLKKNSSQAKQGTLQDAELAAAQTTICTLEVRKVHMRFGRL